MTVLANIFEMLASLNSPNPGFAAYSLPVDLVLWEAWDAACPGRSFKPKELLSRSK